MYWFDGVSPATFVASEPHPGTDTATTKPIVSLDQLHPTYLSSGVPALKLKLFMAVPLQIDLWQGKLRDDPILRLITVEQPPKTDAQQFSLNTF